MVTAISWRTSSTGVAKEPALDPVVPEEPWAQEHGLLGAELWELEAAALGTVWGPSETLFFALPPVSSLHPKTIGDGLSGLRPELGLPGGCFPPCWLSVQGREQPISTLSPPPASRSLSLRLSLLLREMAI